MKHKFRSMGRVAIALVLALSLSLVMTVPVSAATMTVTATPDNAMAGATTDYTIVLTTATTDTIVSVEMEFEAGFDVSAATKGTPITNIGAGTVSSALQVVTYTVTTPASIDDGVGITITLSGIVNPAAGDYEVTVRTKDAFEYIIDQGIDEVVTITAAPVSFAVVVVTQVAGTAFTVEITAKDEAAGAGSDVIGYTGLHLIDFTSTATAPKTIPAFEMVEFTAGAGTTSASFVLNVVETGRTITATDTELNVIGTSDPFSVGLAAVDYLTITGAPASVIAGEAFADDIIVTAYDAEGNVMTTNTSEVAWTSSDTAVSAGAGLPVAHDLVDGTWTFSGSGFTLETAGALSKTITLPRTITATVGSLSRVASIIVYPAAASKLDVTAATPSIGANGYDSSVITATVLDEFGNLVKTSTDITFETSVGEFANGTSTYSVAYTYHASPSGYYAKATLTSTDEGLATIMVTSGTLTYATDTVELTTDTKPTEVWVDDDYDAGLYNGGHDWDVDAFNNITAGVGAVAAGGTVNVATGTYTHAVKNEGFPIVLDKDGVTLRSTGTTAATIIEALTTLAISITGDDVIVDGFNIKSDTVKAISIAGADDAIVRNNTITAIGTTEIVGITPEAGATDVIISGNTLVNATIYLSVGLGSTVSGNRGNTINISPAFNNNVITGNTLCDIVSRGIVFNGEAGTHKNNLIEGNTLSRNTRYGIHLEGANTPTITNLTITGNTITDNGEAGIIIDSGVVWGTGNTINNNNISGNLDFGIDNVMTAATIINAENNWWGDVSGPYNAATNDAGTGDEVRNEVDYRPWLLAPYSAPVGPVTTIDLEAGWNFISVPKRMAATTDTFGELLEGISVVVAYSYDPVSGWSAAKVDADPVEVLEGYWVDVTTAGTITLSYKEAAQAVPASKSLVGDAWNAIGFSRTTALDADTALMSVYGSWSTILGWDAEGQAYEDSIIVGTTGNMLPGKGYWIWMTEDDVLSAISG